MKVELHPNDLHVGESLVVDGRTFVVEEAGSPDVLERLCKEVREAEDARKLRIEIMRSVGVKNPEIRRRPCPPMLNPAAKPDDSDGYIHLNGDGMCCVMRDAFLMAFNAEKGNLTRVSQRLKITRGTAINYKKRFLTQKNNVRAKIFAPLIALLLLVLPAMAQPQFPSKLPDDRAARLPDYLLMQYRTNSAMAAPMAAPSQIAVSQVTNSVTLEWNPSPSPEATGYIIYLGIASGVYTNQIDVGNVTNVTIRGLQWGVRYYFAAAAHDAAGLESAFSNEATYTVSAAPQPKLSISIERFKLDWYGLANVTYSIQWTTNVAKTNWTTYATVLSGTNMPMSFLATNDSPWKFWRVQAK